MSKVLVISDIHHRYEMFSNKLQKLFNPDLTIFLGDYFDSNTETAKQIEKTASQLKWSLLQKNRIHLIGNHDSYYASQGKRFFRTTKSFRWKQDIIDQYINENVWLSCFKFTHIIDNIIFSHAGLSNHWFPQSICYELNYK